MAKFECGKCSGRGHISAYAHVAGGACFACNGRGYKIQKSAPRPNPTFSFSFLWLDENAANFANGEFTRCFNKKARNAQAAERIAAQAMARNGSVDFKVERVA